MDPRHLRLLLGRGRVLGALQIGHAGAELFGGHTQLRSQRVRGELEARIYLLQPLVGLRQHRCLLLLQGRHLHAEVGDHHR